MSLRIIKPGLQTTIQDGGRPGNLRWGLSRGGAADTFAMALGNLLLGNPPQHPCLEVAITGPEIEFSAATAVAVTGARFDLAHNDRPVGNDEVLQMRPGDRLRFGPLRSGARAYVTLAADFQLAATLDSLSTHVIAGFGGWQGRPLKAGDQIPLQHCRAVPDRKLPAQYRLDYASRPLLRVVPGLEASHFTGDAVARFYAGGFTVSPQSNRMGIRLAGEPLPAETLPQQVSAALCPGTVQVPPNGLPIISFVEGQTIGGYPRIAHVISADVHRLAQLPAGARLDFEQVEQATAHQVLREKSHLLADLPRLL
ncbi:biotin-dependent carboxyltransferase family protein [Microbulbifer salipaludis]|uniref:Biotin-dependent carboxyltransferase family protein n=1 Tax=Microbulbifer salipaludis TaxID=187980 RepID=A0ABS3E5D9_9GAMM|nr:biotin-dependent carboxyltransferase family protein [Microbulbifer salipaludis]MBN8430522.1 biotin-dependent carboxyltransferase family protein [Microbulbifer salipaludis]